MTINENQKVLIGSSYTAPTIDYEVATKKYVDDTAGGTPVSINRVVIDATAGASVADGDCVYLDETDNEWKLADASASATSENLQLGIYRRLGRLSREIYISGKVRE